MNNLEPNSQELRADLKTILADSIRDRYFILKLFGVFMMIGAGISSITLLKGYLFDESYNEGLFQYLPIKLTAMILSIATAVAIFIVGYKIAMIAINLQKAVETNQFIWRLGKLTNKEIVRRRHKGVTRYVYIDNIRCLPFNLTREAFNNAKINDEFIIVFVNKQTFALKS